MKLIIEDDEGRKTVVPVVRDEITIGRQDGNTIKLTERNVSRKHARLWKDSGSLLIEDLGSYNGVRVNGDKIAGPTPVKEGDLIEIGDYDLGIQGKLDSVTTVPPTAKAAAAPAPKPSSVSSAPKPTPPANAPAPAPQAVAPAPAPAPAPMQEAAPSASAGGATAIININKLMAAGAPQIEVRDLPKNEMPRLVGLAGQYRGKEFYLMRTEWKVGRTEENDMQVDHQSISRQHCKFVMEPEGWKLYDNKSANGVKVNNEEYAVAPVKPGDTIELGHVKFRFCAPGEKFTPPPEKVEGAPSAPGKPLPSAAEMMAGAGKAPPAKTSGPAAGKSKLPMIIGGVVVLAVVAVVAIKVLGGGGAEETAAKEAQAAAAKKDWATASAKCEAAGEKCPESLRKKIDAESSGQQTLAALEAALSKGDGDAAMAVLEKCGSEGTAACKQVVAKEEAIKSAYCKKHIEAAKAAKGSNPTTCTEEVGKCLAKDANNAEAQQVQGECSPNKPPPPPPPRENVPSQKDRDTAATRLLAAAVGKVQGGDPAGGVTDFKGCIAQKPSKEILGKCWKNLGIAYSRAADLPNACKALKTYLNFCDAEGDCDKFKGALAKWNCG